MILAHPLDNVLSYKLKVIPNSYQDSLWRKKPLFSPFRHVYLHNNDNGLGSEIVRQIEVPKSKFTYHTEGQFHFGFILFL